jgi:hypothetical protein
VKAAVLDQRRRGADEGQGAGHGDPLPTWCGLDQQDGGPGALRRRPRTASRPPAVAAAVPSGRFGATTIAETTASTGEQGKRQAGQADVRQEGDRERAADDEMPARSTDSVRDGRARHRSRLLTDQSGPCRARIGEDWRGRGPTRPHRRRQDGALRDTRVSR